MKVNMPVTDTEQKLRAGEDLITTTDPKGAVTSSNENFIRISGFSADELIGKNHNTVRHPDMPPAAFENLWQTIKGGRPWMGLVKNRCKNGDYYWVDAYVMPISDGKQIVEYQSVRRVPDERRVARAEKLYQRINKGGSVGKRRLQFGIVNKLTASFGLVLAASLGFGVVAGELGWDTAAAAFGVGILLSYGLARLISAPLLRVAADARSIFENELALKVYPDSEDEIGQIQVALHMQKLELNSIVARLDDSAEQMTSNVRDTSGMMQETNAGIQSQQTEIDQLATAVNEMSCTVQEVARNINEAAEAAKKADEESSNGKREVSATISSIGEVATEIAHASDVVNRLQQESETIGSVLEVIRGVAEQTNLLALNAAIEAARAGEQGRGFAVVADEVRSLASRTQESTQEIQQIIESVQTCAREAVDAMKLGTTQVEGSVEQVRKTGTTLDAIADVVSAITNMNIQNASATEEQISVSEEINRNISNISIVAGEHAERSNNTQLKTDELAQFAEHLQMLVKQFGK